ncbi:restriction endonuclease subunit S [Streptococcus infantis]|uniref:restriction endonuclease subunit S n=1 Tax=Streptococcus infantis TaxID=68892 RepID=UPI0039C448B7
MSKLKLIDVEWGEFKLIDIFDIKDGYYNKKPPLDKDGTIPFLGATQNNNGITAFYRQETIEKWDKVGNLSSKDVHLRFFPGNCLAVTNNGSVGHIYYQLQMFTCSHDITPLYLKNYVLTKELAHFLIPLLQKSGESFEYGKKWRPKRMRKSKLMLPVDSQGQLNWQFMEDYIKQEQKQQAQKIIDYYERKLVELAGDVVGLDKVEWKTFRFTDVFQEIQRGKRLTKANQTNGPKPYISSTSENNGVDAFIGNNTGVRKFEDVLTLANSGSVGSTFYQQFEFVASDHVTALKSENADKYAYLFLSTVVKRLEEKYSFNREINDTRIKREKIILPADKQGNPDFQYMSDFVKKLELDKVQEVLEYIYIYIRMMTILEEKVCEISWKDFWIEDVCEIKSGIRLTKANQEIGLRPFVGASDSDNGVTAFVSNTNKSLDANVLGVNYNGSVVENFYHPYEAIFSDDVKRLKWKDEIYGNKYTYLFLKQMILSQKIKYAYGYKFNGERMKRQKIMLPVAETGLPDYDYMKSYMQKQELEQIFKILNYLNKENTHV